MYSQNPTVKNSSSPLSLEQDYELDSVMAELIAVSSPRQRAVLGLLAVSHCYDLPLPPMLSRLSGETSGGFSRQAMYLAFLVHGGQDPVDAVLGLDRVLTSSSALALQVARDNGNLPQLYRAVLERSREYESDADFGKDDDVRFSRLLFRGFFTLWVILFIMMKVIPEFCKMFQEFGIELHPLMQLLMANCDRAAKLWFLGLFLLIPICIWLGRRYLRRWNPMTWRQPTVSRASRRRRWLAIVSRDNNSSETGLAKILRCLPVKRFFPKLAAIQDRVEGGATAWDSLATEGAITKRESKVLASTTNGDTQAWLLRWNARVYGNRAKLRSSLLVNMMIWSGNILLALIVLLVCAAVMGSLIQIMEGLQ